MEIIVGKLAGFCGGVINSVTKTEELLQNNHNLYCLGELVHNKQVVDKLKNNGLKIIEALNDVSDNSNVIIRAHGVAKDVYEEAKIRNINLYDLTCPKVLNIHDMAQKLVKEGYFIILIAQKVHPEAIGTISFCGKDSIILEEESQINEIISVFKNSKKNKVAIISQTTFSVNKFNNLVRELKRELVDIDILVNNTICSATDLRQKETNEISKKVDAMIIIGGKNSSNTKKLYEIALSHCENSYIIETLDDLNIDLSKYESVGVMAGASTPKESIEEVIEYLKGVNI